MKKFEEEVKTELEENKATLIQAWVFHCPNCKEVNVREDDELDDLRDSEDNERRTFCKGCDEMITISFAWST